MSTGDVVRDAILGVSDGLTVSFALAAGLSGANVSTSIILTSGLAEVAGGAISMGLGGSLMASGMGGRSGSMEARQKLLKDHSEKHFMAGDVVRDAILGVSDGLTVPFALAAGLSGANVSASIILTAGLAEVAAGAISMGLGGYLAAKSEADHYNTEYKREQDEIINVPDTEAAEVAEILSEYGLEPQESTAVVNALRKRPQAWLDFMMKFELGLEKPEPRRALESAFTIAIAYIIGGLVPLFPYMFITNAEKAVMTSVGVTLVALLFFGYVKGRFTGNKPIRSALQTALIGAIASAAAFGMAKAVKQ